VASCDGTVLDELVRLRVLLDTGRAIGLASDDFKYKITAREIVA